MKIGIDISQAAYTGTGVARYTSALVKSLLAYDIDNVYAFLFTALRANLPKDVKSAIVPPHMLYDYPFPPTLTSFMWNTVHHVHIERFIGNVDVFISSDWTQPPTRKAKKVTIIHDLVTLVHPETSTSKTTFNIPNMNVSPNIVETQRRRLEWVKKECDHVIADSQSTKKDIVKHLKVPARKITVVYPSIHILRPTQTDVKRTAQTYKLSRPYILTVGTVQPRKNIGRLIEAFVQGKLYDTHDLVIVGAKGWGTLPEIDMPKEARTHIRFLGFVPEVALFSLYIRADLFIMPSLYEGFGYPVVEAMAMGCPVAASQTSSQGELVKGYGNTFDPESVPAIQKALLLARTKKNMAKVKKAQTYALSFTQERFAHEILNVLGKL